VGEYSIQTQENANANKFQSFIFYYKNNINDLHNKKCL